MTATSPRFTVTVFCGSASGHDPVYVETAAALGRAIAVRGWTSCSAAGTWASWAPWPTPP